jgi:hypothetical protein
LEEENEWQHWEEEDESSNQKRNNEEININKDERGKKENKRK